MKSALSIICLVEFLVLAPKVQASLRTIKIEGASNLVLAIQDTASSFGKKNQVGITPSANGSGAAIDCLNVKKCDLGLVAEDSVKPGDSVLESKLFAISPVVIVVEKKLPVDSVTTDQLKAIFSGKIQNWKEIGGPDIPVKAVQRRAGSSITQLFAKFAPVASNLESLGTAQAMRNRFKAKEFAGGITYTSGITGDDLKVLTLDGVTPSEQTVREGKWKMVQKMFLAYRKDASTDKDLMGLVNHLLNSRTEIFTKSDFVVP